MRQKDSFTLIELLLVIVLVGALATALLAALNPLELIHKGHDTTVHKVANEFYNAFIRSSKMEGSTPFTEDKSGVSLNSAEGRQIIDKLIENRELKQDFITLTKASLPDIYFTGKVDLSFAATCFKPVSRNYLNDPLYAYNKYGEKINCTSGSCYVCIGPGDFSPLSPTPVPSCYCDLGVVLGNECGPGKVATCVGPLVCKCL